MPTDQLRQECPLFSWRDTALHETKSTWGPRYSKAPPVNQTRRRKSRLLNPTESGSPDLHFSRYNKPVCRLLHIYTGRPGDLAAGYKSVQVSIRCQPLEMARDNSCADRLMICCSPYSLQCNAAISNTTIPPLPAVVPRHQP